MTVHTTTDIGQPDAITPDRRGFTARWRGVCDLAPEHGRERTANVVLSVTHIERRGYAADLMNEAQDSDGIRSVLFDFNRNAPVKLVRAPAARMSRAQLQAVLRQAIAETQRLYASEDERVRALWQGVGC